VKQKRNFNVIRFGFESVQKRKTLEIIKHSDLISDV